MGICSKYKKERNYETFKESQEVFKKKNLIWDVALGRICYWVVFELEITVCGGEGRLNKTLLGTYLKDLIKRRLFGSERKKKDYIETKLPLKT